MLIAAFGSIMLQISGSGLEWGSGIQVGEEGGAGGFGEGEVPPVLVGGPVVVGFGLNVSAERINLLDGSPDPDGQAHAAAHCERETERRAAV